MKINAFEIKKNNLETINDMIEALLEVPKNYLLHPLGQKCAIAVDNYHKCVYLDDPNMMSEFKYELEEDIKENDDWDGEIPDDSDSLERFSFYYVWIGYESDCGDNSGEYSYFSNEDMANDFFESSKNTDKTLGTASFINGRLEPVKVLKSTL